ncbi:MAG: aldo/keto reductase [Bacillota bacterium]|nr:aldo/keto reductase [Bacillota bacterium]MDW7670170.1 aldo/keto reductase [Bacillota bacterium]
MLNKILLGNSGLEVSEFCLGLLPIGPLQANKPESEIVDVIEKAIDYGVNFVDTAEGYKTQEILGKAVLTKRKEIIISTKSHSVSYDEMARSFSNSLRELKTDYIDIFHLHSARDSSDLFDRKSGAHKYLLEMKEQKVLHAVGVSTHSTKIVRLAAQREDIDVIFSLFNRSGIGILDGNLNDMLEAIALGYRNGKGIYAMKALGGGNLLHDYYGALNWVRSNKHIHSIAMGVINLKELEMNLKVFGVEEISDDAVFTPILFKKLHIYRKICIGCGTCTKVCPNYALKIEEEKAVVNPSRCIMCGYCSPHCPEFAIRLI